MDLIFYYLFTVPVIIRSETTPAVKSALKMYTGSDTTIYADENKAYDPLHAIYDMKRINHSFAYSHDDACTNGAEGWFSRLRRAEIGQHHHISGKHLHAYANESAYREDILRADKPNAMLNGLYIII